MAAPAVDEVRLGFAGTVGNTPLIKLRTLSEITKCNILAKAEYLNPGGSVKDRPAKFMIEEAEKKGLLKPGMTVIEATAGNTGIGLALMCNSKGYPCQFFCPDKTATEKIELLKLLGAEVVVVPGVPITDDNHFSKVAKRKADEIGAFFVNQFYNESNLTAHYTTTGPEIWRQTNGTVDAVVMAAGTGGTIGGVSNFLKEKNEKIRAWLIDTPGTGVKYTDNQSGKVHMEVKPTEEKEKEGSTTLEGIGPSALYYPLSQARIDGVFAGYDQIAIEMAHYLLKNEGIFVGSTSGLNVVGAVWLATMLGPGHTIVTVLCDGGNNHRSKSFNPQWLQQQSLVLTPNPDASHFVSAFQQEQRIKVQATTATQNSTL